MLKFTKRDDASKGRYIVKKWNGARWIKVARISINNDCWKVMEIVGKRLVLLYFGNSKTEAFHTLEKVRS